MTDLRVILNYKSENRVKNTSFSQIPAVTGFGLITRRSQVQVLPPLLRDNRRPPGYPKQAGPAVFDSKSLPKRRFSMNQRPTGLNVTKAITGFLQYKSAEGLSPVTVSGYDRDLKLWIEYQGDMDVAAVETTHILAYLNYLRTDYVPRRITGNNDKKLSPKSVYNLYISVASFFTWASREFDLNNPMK
jgi:hypothetical protein